MKILRGGGSEGCDIFFYGEGAHYNREGTYFFEKDAYFYGEDACFSDEDKSRHGVKLCLEIAEHYTHFHIAATYLHGEDQFPQKSFLVMWRNYMFGRRRGGLYQPL